MATTDIEMAATTRSTTASQETHGKPHGILRLTVDVPHSTRPRDPSLPPARWSTPEFIAYYVLVALAFVPAISAVTTLSSSACPCRRSSQYSRARIGEHANYPMYSRRLSPGWMFGRRVVRSWRTVYDGG